MSSRHLFMNGKRVDSMHTRSEGVLSKSCKCLVLRIRLIEERVVRKQVKVTTTHSGPGASREASHVVHLFLSDTDLSVRRINGYHNIFFFFPSVLRYFFCPEIGEKEALSTPIA